MNRFRPLAGPLRLKRIPGDALWCKAPTPRRTEFGLARVNLRLCSFIPRTRSTVRRLTAYTVVCAQLAFGLYILSREDIFLMHLQQTKRGSRLKGGPQYYFHDLTDPVKTYLRKKGAVRLALCTPPHILLNSDPGRKLKDQR